MRILVMSLLGSSRKYLTEISVTKIKKLREEDKFLFYMV